MTRSPLAIVVGYEDHIEAVGLPDPNDRHIVAAGIAAGAAVILTWNLRHFPAAALKRFGLRRATPDAFLSDRYDNDPEVVIGSLANARRNLSRSHVSASDFIDILDRQKLVQLRDEHSVILAICNRALAEVFIAARHGWGCRAGHRHERDALPPIVSFDPTKRPPTRHHERCAKAHSRRLAGSRSEYSAPSGVAVPGL